MRKSAGVVGVDLEVLTEQEILVRAIVPRRNRCTCRVCGRAWTVIVNSRSGRAPCGWRKCPKGCNGSSLSRG